MEYLEKGTTERNMDRKRVENGHHVIGNDIDITYRMLMDSEYTVEIH